MSKKIQDRVKFLLNKHNNTDLAAENLKEWTTDREQYLLSKLDWMEKSIDSGNHEAYRIAFNQMTEAIKNQKLTLDKVHTIMLFEDKPSI